MPSHPLLEARRISRRGADGTYLLQDIDFTVEGGQRLALVGPSGSGKTLLLRALALLDQLDEGEVLWQGARIGGSRVPEFRRHAMYLHQRSPLWEGTVRENLQRPYQLRVHRDRRYDESRIVQRLEDLGRDASFLAKSQRDLSGGEGQVVALLRSVQLEPEVLLLDEPTAALDAGATEAVERLIAGWLGERPEERAFVWVSHDMGQAQRMAQHVFFIRQGRLEPES